jgi:hypothetical protein
MPHYQEASKLALIRLAIGRTPLITKWAAIHLLLLGPLAAYLILGRTIPCMLVIETHACSI